MTTDMGSVIAIAAMAGGALVCISLILHLSRRRRGKRSSGRARPQAFAGRHEPVEARAPRQVKPGFGRR